MQKLNEPTSDSSSMNFSMNDINLIEMTYRQLCNEGRPILKLFSGNPNEHGLIFPPEILQKSYSDYFSRQYYHPNPKGALLARQSIAFYYQSRHVAIEPDHILLTSGSSESFLHLFCLLGENGGNFLMPQPSYPLFDHIARMAKVELRQYPLREKSGWSIDLRALKACVDAHTRAIILISPHNPTGAVHSAEEIQALVEWANFRGLPLICDEVFSEFYFGEGEFPRVIRVAKPRLCFTLNGISKMFALPGLKLSWIAVTGESTQVSAIVDRLELFTDTYLACNVPIQHALPAIFSEGSEFLKHYQSQVSLRRSLALEVLETCRSVELVPPRGGFYLMARVVKSKFKSEEDFVIQLMKETGVFIHPGHFYDEEEGVHFVISFLMEPTTLQEGLSRLCRWL